MNAEQASEKNINPDRDRLLREFNNLNHSISSEHPSIRQVELWKKDNFRCQQIQAILNLSDATGLEIRLIEGLGQLEHNVINNLIIDGRLDLAREVALNPAKIRSEQPELFRLKI